MVEELEGIIVVFGVLIAERILGSQIQRIHSVLGEELNTGIGSYHLRKGLEDLRMHSNRHSVIVFWIEAKDVLPSSDRFEYPPDLLCLE